MIAFLEGILEDKQPTRIVINCQGVGYEVLIPLSTYDQLPTAGKTCRVLTHDYVREDARHLYGFFRESDRELFVRLLSISGIGPKIALSALSGLPARDIKAAVFDGDVKRLSSISGIGKKMAERMVTELRHVLDEGDALEAAAVSAGVPGDDRRFRDAVLALVALGYKQPDAQKLARDAMADAPPEEGVEGIVRRALVKA